MSDNIWINGRTAVHAGSNGTLNTIDVCLTRIGNSVVPIPYPNVAQSKDADKTAEDVYVQGNPACHLKSTFAKSTGDQPGNRKGIVSGVIKGEATFVSSSFNHFIENQPSVRAFDLMVSNKKNTSPMPLVQPLGTLALPTVPKAPEVDDIVWPNRLTVAIRAESGDEKERLAVLMTDFETQRKAITLTQDGDADGEPRKRRLTLDNLPAGNTPVALTITDQTHGQLLLPLGETDTHTEDDAPDQTAIDLLPITPLRRLPGAEKPQNGLGGLRDGWLYIYVNNHLWRELKVTDNGTAYQDVNLAHTKGQHERLPTGDRLPRITVPYRLDNAATEVSIAYSETQWSWDRIDQLGGLNPEDPRQTLGQGDACETPYSAGFCQQQCEQRLTALDLAAVEDDFGQCEPDTPLRLVDGGELDAYYTDLIDTGALRGAPAVILPDPLGDARYHAYQHCERADLLDGIAMALLEDPSQPAADGTTASPREQHEGQQQARERRNALADRHLAALFNNQILAGIDTALNNPNLDADTRAALEKRKEYQDLLDRDAIETLLEKDACTALIDEALDHRLQLVALFDTPALYQALIDYHTLSGLAYFQLFDTLTGLIDRLGRPLADSYKSFFLNPDDHQRYLDQDPGRDFLLRLTDAHPSEATHNLYHLLFPKQPDENNPLKLDLSAPNAEPGPDEPWCLDPQKVSALAENLNQDLTLEVNWTGTGINAARYVAHVIHAFNEQTASLAFGQVEAIQQVEVKRGKTSAEIDAERKELESLTKEGQDLSTQLEADERSLASTEERVKTLSVEYQEARLERAELLKGGTLDDLKAQSHQNYLKVVALNAKIDALDKELDAAHARKTQLSAMTRQNQQAHKAIEQKITKHEATAQGQPFSLVNRLAYSKNHNKPLVGLYALFAGEHLQAVSLTPSDLLDGHLPDDTQPFSAAGRRERLTRLSNLAKLINNDNGPQVTYRTPNANLRVPAELAINKAADLQQYIAFLDRQTLARASDQQEQRITQILYDRRGQRAARDQATLETINDDQRLARARYLEQKLDDVEPVLKNETRQLFEYKGQVYSGRKNVEQNREFIRQSEMALHDLDLQLKQLDESPFQVRFGNHFGRMLMTDRLVVTFEAFNLVNVLLSGEPKSIRTYIDLTSSVADFVATVMGVIQQRSRATYGTTDKMAQRLAIHEKNIHIKTGRLTSRIVSRAKNITFWASTLNMVSGVLTSAMAIFDGVDAMLKGDKGAATGFGMMAIGGGLTAVTTFISAEATIMGLIGVSLCLNVVGFILLVVGVIVVAIFQDTPLEKLLKNSPFGQVTGNRFGQGGLPDPGDWIGLDNDEEFRHWQDHRDSAYHECLTHFFEPRVSLITDYWEHNQRYLKVQIDTPAITPTGAYQFEFLAEDPPYSQYRKRQEAEAEGNSYSPWKPIAVLGAGGSGDDQVKHGTGIIVESDARHHNILIPEGRLASFLEKANHFSLQDIPVRVRVQTFPKGKEARLLPGSSIDYVLPAPKRDEQNKIKVDGKYIPETELDRPLHEVCWQERDFTFTKWHAPENGGHGQ